MYKCSIWYVAHYPIAIINNNFAPLTLSKHFTWKKVLIEKNIAFVKINVDIFLQWFCIYIQETKLVLTNTPNTLATFTIIINKSL